MQELITRVRKSSTPKLKSLGSWLIRFIRTRRGKWITGLLVFGTWYACCLPGRLFSDPASTVLLDKDGKLLGKIKVTEATSNCAFSPDEKTLFITADMYVVRVKLRD